MSDGKFYIVFVLSIFLILIFIKSFHTIFPFMDDDEYFVDEYGCIHGNGCPYNSAPWFTIKHSKYNFLMEEGQEICRECLLLEEDKLMNIDEINKNNRSKHKRR